MYKCSKCLAPLTELDVGFYQNLHPHTNPKDCSCFKCTAGNGMYSDIQKAEAEPKIIKLHKRALVATIIPFLFLLIGFALENADGLLSGIGVLFIVLSYASAIISIFYIPSRIAKIVTFFGYEPSLSYAGGSPYESTMESDGTIKTEKVTDYSYSGGVKFYHVILFFTYAIWSIPHLIYLCINAKKHFRLRMKYPHQAIDAYYLVRNQITRLEITNDHIKWLYNTKRKYQDEVEKIKSKYLVLGPTVIENEIKRTNYLPAAFIKSERQKYILVEDKYIGSRKNTFYVLHKSNCNDITGKIIYDNFFIYSETADWLSEWHDTKVDQATIDRIPAYKKFFNIHT